MNQRTSIVALGVLFLLGCDATQNDLYLYREGATVARADRDFFDCRLAAARAVPTNTQIGTTPTYTTPIQTNCYNVGYTTQCTTTGGQVYGGRAYSYDANSNIRTEFLARCLASKGYSAVELPRCDTSKIPQSILQRLAGKQRPPREGACYVPISENAGNVLYASETGGG